MSFVIKQPLCVPHTMCPMKYANILCIMMLVTLQKDICTILNHQYSDHLVDWRICDHLKLVMTLVLVCFLFVFVSEELVCSCNKPLWFTFVIASKDPIWSDIPATCSFHYFSQWYLFPDYKNLTNYFEGVGAGNFSSYVVQCATLTLSNFVWILLCNHCHQTLWWKNFQPNRL